METEQKKLPKSQLEITFELTADEFIQHFEHALEHLKSHVKVDGFREGKAPAKIVEEKLKPEALLMEAGEHAVQHVYSDYVRENNLEPIGQPEVKIIKIAKGSPFVFTAKITLLPEVELPDYKKIASGVKGKEVSVTEEEVKDSLNYLQKSRAKMTLKSGDTASGQALKGDFVEIEYSCEKINEGKATNDQFVLGEGGFVAGFEDKIIGMKSGEEKTFDLPLASQQGGEKGNFKLKVKSVNKMELPEINDEFAKQLGAFDNVVALKNSIKEGITTEKTEAEEQRKRAEILDKIAEKTKVELPHVMVEYEKKRLLDDLKNKIQSMKMTFESYLAAIKKTEEEIKDTFEKEAEKKLRGFLVLREIGKKENIQVSEKELDEEVDKAIKNFSKDQISGCTVNGVLLHYILLWMEWDSRQCVEEDFCSPKTSSYIRK